MKMIIVWLALLALGVQVVRGDERPFVKCFKEIVAKTQSCENKNLLYVSTMGISSGFGSEFNTYLVWSLITAIFQNRFFIHLRTQSLILLTPLITFTLAHVLNHFYTCFFITSYTLNQLLIQSITYLLNHLLGDSCML